MAKAKTQEHVFKWIEGEPPPEPARRTHVEVILEKVAERAGQWARITGPYKNPSYAKNMVKAWKEKFGDFDFMARPGMNGDEQYYVYALKRKGARRLQVSS